MYNVHLLQYSIQRKEDKPVSIERNRKPQLLPDDLPFNSELPKMPLFGDVRKPPTPLTTVVYDILGPITVMEANLANGRITVEEALEQYNIATLHIRNIATDYEKYCWTLIRKCRALKDLLKEAGIATDIRVDFEDEE